MSLPREDEDCGHGFSDPRWCSDCTPRAKPEPTGPTHAGAIKAQFASKCGECRDPIDEGDWIVSDPRGFWIHDECA